MSLQPSANTLVDVTTIIISSYAHPIIFAISLFSILWGGICAALVSSHSKKNSLAFRPTTISAKKIKQSVLYPLVGDANQN